MSWAKEEVALGVLFQCCEAVPFESLCDELLVPFWPCEGLEELEKVFGVCYYLLFPALRDFDDCVLSSNSHLQPVGCLDCFHCESFGSSLALGAERAVLFKVAAET